MSVTTNNARLLAWLNRRSWGKSARVTMTDSQFLVLGFLASYPQTWFRPADIRPDGYQAGASTIGRILGSLKAKGLVESRKSDRGNGTSCLEWTVSRSGLPRRSVRKGAHR